MKLPDYIYNLLKWITMIVLPALATAYVGLSAIWGFPYADEVAKTTAVICTLLGALLGISTAEYNKHGGMIDYSDDKYWDDEDDEDVKIWPKEEGDKA